VQRVDSKTKAATLFTTAIKFIRYQRMAILEILSSEVRRVPKLIYLAIE